MVTDPARETLGRLLAVDWHDEFAFRRRRSREKLLREYLRRAALWARAVNATDDWPFFDIAAHVAPSVRADPDVVDQVEKLITDTVGSGPVGRSCLAAVHWSALRAHPDVRLPTLPDPYAPLLVLFDRGGGFHSEHGFIDVDGASVRRMSWQDHLSETPVVELDPAVLDTLDHEGRR